MIFLSVLEQPLALWDKMSLYPKKEYALSF